MNPPAERHDAAPHDPSGADAGRAGERTTALALPATPALDALLARVRQRLAALVWMHGLATVAGATALWLLVAFVVDWSLHVPSGIRWIHLGVLALVPGVLFARELVAPLRRLPDVVGIAVLVERAHPALRQLFVSAVELSRSPRPMGAPELVADVLRRADAEARTLQPSGVLDARGPRRRLALGSAAVLVCALVLATNSAAASIFFDRLFGGDAPWPRRTHLVVEIPLPGAETPSELQDPQHDPAEIRLRIARGSDVPLVVRAEGSVPDEVILHFKSGESAVLPSTGGPAFRTLLRSLQDDTEFYVTGGDDTDDRPWVRLQVLQPPDVEALAIEITPPAYSGLAPRTEFDRDIEVLQGTHLAVHVLPTPRSAHGRARLLPEDRALELEAAPFPLRPEAAPGTAVETGLAFALAADKNLRYRFELQDATGLANPDPGLFAVTVVEDRAPEIELLAPSRTELDTLLGGLVALRARAEDDFGLASFAWSSRSATDETRAAAPAELDWRLFTAEERAAEQAGAESASNTRARVLAVGRAHVEVAQLAPAVAEGQQYELVVTARDNRTPTPREGRSSAVRVRIVTTDEFVRRLQERLTRVQASANAVTELQREKARRTDELLAALESDGAGLANTDAELGALSTGQRRAAGDARSLARELCSVCESILYARLDDRAGPLLDFVDARLATSVRRQFDPAPWRALAEAQTSGELAPAALSSKLVGIVGLALEISEDDTQGAAEALLRAQQATEPQAVHAGLAAASSHARLALEKLDRLLGLLSEWDNFQSVLGLTRDLLNGQKNLQERTKAALKEK